MTLDFPPWFLGCGWQPPSRALTGLCLEYVAPASPTPAENGEGEGPRRAASLSPPQAAWRRVAQAELKNRDGHPHPPAIGSRERLTSKPWPYISQTLKGRPQKG